MSDQKPKQEFSTEYPTSQVPTLPEYFRADTLDGVLPGDVVFPYKSAVKVDKSTGALFVSGASSLDHDDLDPRSIDGYRVGILRIHEQIGDLLVDGFIADCRYLKPGSLTPEIILPSETDTDFDKKWVEENKVRQQLVPLLGAVFSDPDGKPHFSGDEKLQGYVSSLMDSVDAQIAKSKTPTEAKTVAEPELAKKALGSDYYHG
jgi:hypothetical protein